MRATTAMTPSDEGEDVASAERSPSQFGSQPAPIATNSARQAADGAAGEEDQGEAAEEEHAGEGHDERRDADEGDPEALPRADEGADQQGDR